ncbi:MAG: SpoIIE family protein phosphatase [Anaerolineae bacterium]|nr:SpoIIE family protein phosphatase [Anaerolineae bacterium]
MGEEYNETNPLDRGLYTLAAYVWPKIREMNGKRASGAMTKVIGFLLAAPLAAAGLAWLIAITDLALLAQNWLSLLAMFGLLLIFERLVFLISIEVRPGDYSGWQGSLSCIIIWAAALLYGPSALWLSVLWLLVTYALLWRRDSTEDWRWNLRRNFATNLAQETLITLVALSLYRRWGGQFPFPGLYFATVLPAFAATLVRFAGADLLWMPSILWLGKMRHLSRELRRRQLYSFLLGTGWQLLVEPFAVLLAGITTQNGSGGFLFFVAGLLIVSYLAHRLSQSMQQSRQRSLEVEHLEQLSWAIINAPPDASALPEVLAETVPPMFPGTQIEIRLFPDRVLFQQGESRLPVPESAWDWLSQTVKARAFAPGEILPWTQTRDTWALVAAPIVVDEREGPAGGVFLANPPLMALPQTGATLLPAMQSLAERIASAFRNADTYRQMLENQRVLQELEMAGRIQASFLPATLPEVPGWQLAAALRPARQACGDFYDVIPLPNGRLGILIADVADKGMGAALVMALSRTLLRTYAVEYHSRPDFVMRVVNRRMLADSDAGMFVTAFYGVLDPHSGTLSYCNAGHHPPLLLQAHAASGNGITPLTRTGTVLGILEGVNWEQATVRLEPEDVLVLYTDGVTDAENREGEFFEEARLHETLQTTRGSGARDVCATVLDAVSSFTRGAPPFDDITLMVLSRATTD